MRQFSLLIINNMARIFECAYYNYGNNSFYICLQIKSIWRSLEEDRTIQRRSDYYYLFSSLSHSTGMSCFIVLPPL